MDKIKTMNPSKGAVALMAVLRFYKRFVSPLLPPVCRFTPSCSEYMFEAIARFGAGKGVYLGVKRLLRCHPFSKGGHDPVQ
jgi:putative membrane protein insertion efficiency factor